MADLKPFDINELEAVEVSLASPQQIREWSFGEVTKPETINYRTQKPEADGLFCERIFGPAKDYTCRCGKYTKKQYAGVVCEKCGTEVTVKDVRRERMGHIELATPCTHIWFLKGASASTIGKVIDVKLKELQEVAYFNAFICLNEGISNVIRYGKVYTENEAKVEYARAVSEEIIPALQKKAAEESRDIADDTEYERANELVAKLSNHEEGIDFTSANRFLGKHLGCSFGEGGEAIKKMLQEVDIDKEYTSIIAQMGSDSRVRSFDINGLDKTYDIQMILDHVKTHENVKDCFFSRRCEKFYVILNEDKEFNLNDEFAAVLGDMSKISIRATRKAEGPTMANLIKRLSVITAFKKSKNKPEWMVLDVLPVIPPSLRPMTQIGGKFVASDLNELYRRVIIRNSRLKKDLEGGAPSVILNNEKRMLQNAVDALIDNSRCAKPFKGPGGREYKSLTSALKGKPGRFRQNLLGKRVDFSGRSVIAVGPDLKMYQCGLPREMAIQLLRPFIEQILIKTPKEGQKASVQNGFGKNYREANRMIDAYDPIVYSIIERIIGQHPVLLNRAPTLHRLGIQAFQPKLVDGRAIRLHPLVCKGFNADFDGDQMAVHVPLSKEAQEEAVTLMLASNNILGPKNGKPIAVPSQDMILGNYYLSIEESAEDFKARAKKAAASKDDEDAEKYNTFAEAEGKVFRDVSEVFLAYETRQASLHNRIAIPANKCGKFMPNPANDLSTEDWEKLIRIFGDISLDEYKEIYNSYLVTTVGKIIFNSIFPNDFPYVDDPKAVKAGSKLITKKEYFAPKGTDLKKFIANKTINGPIKKKQLELIVGEVFQNYAPSKTSAVLDAIKNNGFKYSTVAGFTIALSDIRPTQGKDALLKAADEYVDKLTEDYRWGLITDKRRGELVVAKWKEVTAKIEKMTIEQLCADKLNPVFMIYDSGARGNNSQFNQMIGCRGVMSNPKGEAIEIPIKSCFREGLSISEFFISTHGGRKGVTDTALKTAESGYLTRRLVDVAQNIVITEDDCHADHGFVVKDINTVSSDGSVKTIVHLADRLIGRYAAYDVCDPATGAVLAKGTIGREYEDFVNDIMTKDIADKIVAAGIKEVEIRSVLCCKTRNGVCKTCYGLLVATNSLAKVGDAVGIMAGQSIGEPGTQLTMRTFHSGGVAGDDIVQGLPRVQELVEARQPKRPALITAINGIVDEVKEDNEGKFTFIVRNDIESETYVSSKNSKPLVKKGDKVEKGDQLTAGSIFLKEFLQCAPKEKVQNYILEETLKVYSTVGELISDKHIEIIIRQMFSKVWIDNGGDTSLMPGYVDINEFEDANAIALAEGGEPAQGNQVIKGIKDIAKGSTSFLSAASFQETTSALTTAAINSRRDDLQGLKENVICGRLIPAGTGTRTREEEDEIIENFSVTDSIEDIDEEYHN